MTEGPLSRASLPAALVIALLPGLSACRVPPLEHEPWSAMHAGAVGVSSIQPLIEFYDIDADFRAIIPVQGETFGSDSEPIKGIFAHALAVDYFVTDSISVQLGADYRRYEVDDLVPDGLLPVFIDTIDSLQYYAGVRKYFAPLAANERFRPYGGLNLAYMPEVDIEAEIDLSEFNPTNIFLDTKGEPFWILGAVAGMLFQWSDHVVFRGGVLYEVPLTPMDVDLSLEIAGSDLPFYAELEPQGPVLFLGASYIF